MGNVKKFVAERTRHKRQYDNRINERQMQSKEGKVDSSKTLDASLVVTECSAIESENSNSEHAFNKSVNESSGIDTGKWKPTGRIFKIAGPRWIPTGNMFIDSITKVDSEPPNGLNDDITNSYECDQTLNVSACTLNLRLVQNSVSPTPYVPPSKKDYEILFQPLFDEYFNPPPRAVSPNTAAVAAPRAVDLAGSPLSTTIDQDVPSAITSPTTQ
nr:hypothetical protein [Tanacetum cinerariifolium]